MMWPRRGLDPGSVWAQRLRQLEQRLRTKEERIVVLETENAVLHLKLAEYQGLAGGSTKEVLQLYAAHGQQMKLQKSSVVTQLHGAIKRLKQDLKSLHSFALELSKDFQRQSKTCLYQVLAAVHGIQLQNEAMRMFQIKAFDLEQSLQEVTERYEKEKQKRKALHNSLVELRGNIRVHCRIRPLLPFDDAAGHSVSQDRQRNFSEKAAYAADDETVLVKCSRPGHASVNKTFQFERVYNDLESQDAVFADVAPLLTSLLDGYNVCIMAYGQTGSGKTYTMLGPQLEGNLAFSIEEESELGIIPRATQEVFRLISEKPQGSYWVEVSVVEVYNNEIFDLLAKDSYGKAFGIKRDVVTTREGKSDVPLLTHETVKNASEFLHLVNKGLQLRVTHPTLVHAHSSRSHLVVTLTITTVVFGDNFGTLWEDEQTSQRLTKESSCTFLQRMRDNKSTSSSRPSSPVQFEATEKMKQVKTRLQLVDLAGSECVGMSGVTGAALRETSFINRSLSALADVLGAIAEQRAHVPYRNSKLTHLLQDSVGGDAKLLVMLCISPGQKYLTESMQSLGFGTRARQVQRGQVKKKNFPLPSKAK
ncbi:kinesin-like protein KIF25 isoform X1 [Corvus cornix cornix]|uniref:kinesin-like protein KIF25 isoform X1 n=3 Tax=Corvus cornix cornix TaxID=932674 RepID=UPI0019523CA3|nr:kinesin-like protein KIF25 isoform X1 [Corvus cornix cornix]XP_041881081.1 kinesin-like protein KIF25 isoform X1 [Corvus kubaryi]